MEQYCTSMVRQERSELVSVGFDANAGAVAVGQRLEPWHTHTHTHTRLQQAHTRTPLRMHRHILTYAHSRQHTHWPSSVQNSVVHTTNKATATSCFSQHGHTIHTHFTSAFILFVAGFLHNFYLFAGLVLVLSHLGWSCFMFFHLSSRVFFFFFAVKLVLSHLTTEQSHTRL